MLIKVKVTPNSKKENILKKSQDSYEIEVKPKAQEGRATKAVIDILSEYFNIETSKIRLVKGGRQRNKIFEIKNCNCEKER